MLTRYAFLFVVSTVALNFSSTKAAADELVTVAGTLSHDRDAWWQVRLDPNHEIQVEGKKVDLIRFGADGAMDHTWCAQFDGQKVEISGKIDSGDTAEAKGSVAIMVLYTMAPGRSERSLAQLMGSLAPPGPNLNPHAPGQPLYRFPYYLVLLDPPNGCERCYVPLLLSPRPLENMASGPDTQDNETVVSITTYERDSIWQVNSLALITSPSMDRASRTINFRGRNYRYESASPDQVLHLLEHPMGTIPISRPVLFNVEVPGATLPDLIAGFRVIFRVRERDTGFASVIRAGESSKVSKDIQESRPAVSELTVSDDGNVEYLATRCANRFPSNNSGKRHMTALSVSALNWNWREMCPDSTAGEKTVSYSLKGDELTHLKDLIGRKEVEDVHGCFCNAAMGLGDFDVEIPRPESTQEIPVVGLMPEHVELREHPAITYLICEGKRISQQVTKQSLPEWCTKLPPLR